MPSSQLVKDQTNAQISEIAKWDPELTKKVVGVLRPIAKRYFRSEVKDLGRIPTGGALLVSNHSGGQTGRSTRSATTSSRSDRPSSSSSGWGSFLPVARMPQRRWPTMRP